MKKKRRNLNKVSRRGLRSGSKDVKRILLEQNPCCDICGKKGNSKTLQLHHVYLIRHGFKTELEHCVLLCDNCHHNFHQKYDRYLDITFEENPQVDFMKIYNVIKRLP